MSVNSQSGSPLTQLGGSVLDLNGARVMGEAGMADRDFQSVAAIPIKVTREQSSGSALATINGTAGQPNGVLGGSSVSGGNSAGGASNIGIGNGNKFSIQYSLANLNVFQNLPKETSRGIDDLKRMEMALVSGIPEEVSWALKKYLTYSNKAPYMIGFKNMPHLLPLFKKMIVDLKPVIETFKDPIGNDKVILSKLQTGLNSLLIIRNLAQDTDCIQILVKDRDIKDFMLFVLMKYESHINANSSDRWEVFQPNNAYFNELIHYTLDLMEAVSSYIAPARKDDPFFQTLVSLLKWTKDRYMVISILRSLSRLLVRSKEDEESAADNLDQRTLTLIVAQLLIENDSELITASFDFLYQFILPGNRRITELFRDRERFTIFGTVLPRLLSYNVRVPQYKSFDNTPIRLVKRLRPPAPTEAPALDQQLFTKLLWLEEPARSTAWLRCCFEPVQGAEVTQIALWKGYESKFGSAVRETSRKMLPAVEFIKNVSNAFTHASAMVILDPATGKKRFVIRGIQPRSKPISIEEGESASRTTLTGIQSKFIGGTSQIKESRQETLPEIKFPTQLSDVSNAAATFLCLISNDTKGAGMEVCQAIKPLIVHQLADIPPLSAALSEYMENTPTL
ncbi:Rsc9p KNAG_0G03560 [Huiozyma naganishii CBS 8797]|uniref:RFX-type winged-helix domain-containing protein n=1 Tax=Huiozyma naganishii (strain ATCC MYA-139 / BCRC 22969 / CBS 8797 / KCTC 17520 / NBRC 10181 / NCYC 3082 / Yp74L-3) TaxID=1071383 RepID=J7RP30_HUIN7|nr:hypothetical protein KNAG_0G03560 [Kazachstania naganishii CBS 8797]CCK71413.1 hypothetical protein KNAG_0G03560 [Kazachstania naganishii CBS 8797]